MQNKMASITIAAAVSACIALATTPVQAKQKMEECYGIAKAAKNDCGTATHSCAGLAKKDKDPNEWKLVPEGTCKKLGGSLTPGDKVKAQ